MRRVTVDVLKRFKHLSRQKEITSFAEICNESFTSYTVILDLDESDFTAGSRSGENEVSHQDVQETVPGPIVQSSPITLSITLPAQTIPGSSLITANVPILTNSCCSRENFTLREQKLKKRLQHLYIYNYICMHCLCS